MDSSGECKQDEFAGGAPGALQPRLPAHRPPACLLACHLRACLPACLPARLPARRPPVCRPPLLPGLFFPAATGMSGETFADVEKALDERTIGVLPFHLSFFPPIHGCGDTRPCPSASWLPAACEASFWMLTCLPGDRQ